MTEFQSFPTMFESTSIDIDNNPAGLPYYIPEGSHFGILKINMKKTKLVKKPMYMLFTVDTTGSMSEAASKGGSDKMSHVKQTFVNMLKYFVTLDTEIYIQVNTFNENVDVLIESCLLTKDNVIEFIDKVKAIIPDCSTDIGKALQTAGKTMADYSEKNPDHQTVHIFMTDGDATIGVRSNDTLATFVDNSYKNIFVGFGLQHNAELLRKLSEARNSDYLFIDNVENTALVYGETIHQFIYPAIQCVEIRAENGVLYDWQTNTWVPSLYEDIIVSEAQKIYHLKTSERLDLAVYIYGKPVSLPKEEGEEDEYIVLGEYPEPVLLDTVIEMPHLIDASDNIIDNGIDLTKYAFRQIVQHTLFRAKEYKNMEYSGKVAFKTEIKETFRAMRKYMREKNMMDDGLLILLCEDLSITYKTLDGRYNHAFTLSRQASQGRQRSYNTATIDEDDLNYIPQPLLRRQNAISSFRQNTMPSQDTQDPFASFDQEDICMSSARTIVPSYDSEDDIDNIDAFNTSGNNTTCFATPSVLNTMRTMSGQPSREF